MAIHDEKYVAFTTYRKNGEAKSLPVWIVDAGNGKVGFTTASSSWKVKRLRNNSHVMLQPSDSKGNVKAGTQAVSGTAETSQGSEFDRISALVKKKYGVQFTMITMMGKAAKMIGKGSGTDTAVLISLDET